MPENIENSERFINEGVHGGTVVFGDMINNIAPNTTGKIIDDPYYGTHDISNPIYQLFLDMDRTEAIRQLRHHFDEIDCTRYDCPIISYKTAVEHRPDWLFDRFHLDLSNRKEAEEFEAKTYPLNDFIEISEIRRTMKQSSGKDFLNTLSHNKYYLYHFKVDVDNDDDKLNQFIVDFYDYWKEKPKHIKCIIFLSIRLRAVSKPSFFRRWFKPKKSTFNFPNFYFIEELEWVKKTDIERFFDNKIQYLFRQREEGKTQYSMQDCWELFANEIDKIIAARKSE